MKNKKGFTFLGFLIVLTIVGFVAAIAIPSMLKARETARVKSMQEKDITLFAKVISVEETSSGATYTSSMAAVLQVEEKPDYVLAVTDYRHITKIARAKAILQSAVASGGIAESLAEITGHYNESGEFEMSHIKANGLEIEL